ncbi:Unknown protein sequence [Pseudomonas syringae pv. maculicola]|nr:Unknown protein sequence [Pseudomonas syringae pv. maculicola]
MAISTTLRPMPIKHFSVLNIWTGIQPEQWIASASECEIAGRSSIGAIK